MDNPIFVIDANVFIEAVRRYYAFDIAPGFWDNLITCAKDGQIFSIDRIKEELERGNDDLYEWVNNKFSDAFVSSDEEEIFQSYREIINWVNNNDQFSDAAKADFANGADGWLIAYANVKNYKVVTQEVLKPDIKNKVPIPNVCQAFNVKFCDTFNMLRQLGVRLT